MYVIADKKNLGFNIASILKAKGLKNRIIFTFSALIIYRLGTYIPLPGVNPAVMMGFVKEHATGMLGMLDMFSGGSLSRMTIMALNLMPYITSSIIIQLLATTVPSLESLKKEGESGRKKINQYTRYLSVFIATFQGYAASIVLEKIPNVVVFPGLFFQIITIITLVGSTLFLMWLGEQITSRGLGNGSSMIIFSGIVANLPQALLKIFDLGRTGVISLGAISFFFAFIVLTVAFSVFIERSYFRLPIQYPKTYSRNQFASGEKVYMPIKLNNTGVLPPIFAGSLLMLPSALLSSLLGQDSSYSFLLKYIGHGSAAFRVFYGALIVFFSFFYTSLVFNAEEVAENLRKNGGFIPGFRPGSATAAELNRILTKLTVIGSAYLLFICLAPEILLSMTNLGIYLAGTSILIVVSVTLETFSQMQSHLVSYKYDALLNKKKDKKIGKKLI